jgi:hypothetical protein
MRVKRTTPPAQQPSNGDTSWEKPQVAGMLLASGLSVKVKQIAVKQIAGVHGSRGAELQCGASAR